MCLDFSNVTIANDYNSIQSQSLGIIISKPEKYCKLTTERFNECEYNPAYDESISGKQLIIL